jgi:hypothetical protein
VTDLGGEFWARTRPFLTRVSAADVRTFVGLADGSSPPGIGWARPAGRRLAMHPMLTGPRPDGLDVVLDVLGRSRALLAALGVRLDVIRIRRGCAVVRAVPVGGLSPGAACEISRGLLETVPAMARGIRATVVETTCRERGADSCLYTLLWDATLGALALYRPYGRHGPWAAQMGPDGAFVLDPALEMELDPSDRWGPTVSRHPPLSGHEPEARGGT